MHEPIAIVGMSGRFPAGADTPDGLWQALVEGRDLVSEIPADRGWDLDALYDPDPGIPGKMYTKGGAFLRGIDQFDAEFFGLTPREAAAVDPQHRLVLEVAWEALEDAGLAADRLPPDRSAIYIGVLSNDFLSLQLQNSARFLDPYTLPGSLLSIAAGRLSYVLNLHGLSLAVESACASSLLAVHLAARSLRAGECDVAIAGGANLILLPEGYIMLCRHRALSPSGRSRTFDISADGYGRGEGCGIVVLKRLSDAIAAADRILAVIRGSAANHDGRSSGLTAPNGLAQQKVLRAALVDAGVSPGDISYVEAHGTGTSVGDSIEVAALAAVLGEGRPKDRKLCIGSVKSNIGHGEAAAGISALIKVILSLRHRTIPPNLHFRKPNPSLALDSIPAFVPISLTPWAQSNGPRIAGISAFGFNGNNVHVIVEEAPEPVVRRAGPERPLHVVTLSAKTESALVAKAGTLGHYFEANANLEFADVAHTLNAGRVHFQHRRAIVADSLAATREQLAQRAFARSRPEFGQPRVAFMLSDQGSLYAGACRELFTREPVFRSALERCDDLARRFLNQPLLSLLYPLHPNDEGRALLLEPSLAQSVWFSLQYALIELWQSWSVRPQGVVAYAAGEYAAALAASVIDLETAFALASARGPAEFEDAVARAKFSTPKIPFVSGVTGDTVSLDRLRDKEYWVQQKRRTIRLHDTFLTLSTCGFNVALEIGPDAVLSTLGVRSGLPIVWLPSVRRGGEWEQMVNSLADLYVHRVDIDWEAVDRPFDRRPCPLPTYPFERKRHWLESVRPRVATRVRHLFLGERLRSPLPVWQYQSSFSIDRLPLLADTKGMVHIGFYAEMASTVAVDWLDSAACEIRQLAISEALFVPAAGERIIQFVLYPEQDGERLFEVSSTSPVADIGWNLHVTGRLARSAQSRGSWELPAPAGEPVDGQMFYGSMSARRGLDLGDSVRWLKRIWCRPGEALCELRESTKSGNWSTGLDPGILDACAQSFYACLDDDAAIYLVTKVDSLTIKGVSGHRRWLSTVVDPAESSNERVRGDFRLLDIQGNLLMEGRGVTMQRVARDAVLKLSASASIGSALPRVDFLNSLKKTSEPVEQLRLLRCHLDERIAPILGLQTGEVRQTESLISLGIDSLMAVQIRNELRATIGARIPVEDLLSGVSIADLAESVHRQLCGSVAPGKEELEIETGIM